MGRKTRVTVTTELGEHDGVEVTCAGLEIRATGSGLQEAMDVDPVKLTVGSKHYVVIEVEAEKHRYEPAHKGDYERLMLVNMTKALRATLVDPDLVAEAFEAQQRRIDEAAGQPQLPEGGG